MLVSIFIFTFFISFFFQASYFLEEILKLIQAQDIIWAITLLFVIGIWTVFLPTIWLMYNFQKHISQYTNLILYFSWNSSFPSDDDDLDISGYIMVRADHAANCKRGGVFIYYKNCLPLKVLDIRFLHESIAFNLQIGEKLRSFIFLCRSLYQSYDDF